MPTVVQGHMVGLVRGQMLFEQQAVELSAQAGAMVGVQEEERLSTTWQRSLWFRHPWLQVNLLTTFLAAAVVGGFEHTIASTAVLAAFVPVMISQCVNVGCQALAVSLRGLTLGELRPGQAGAIGLPRERQPYLVSISRAVACSYASPNTRSGVSGSSRTRTPVAW